MTFTHRNGVRTVIAPSADLYDGDPDGEVLSFALYGHATFFVLVGSGATGTANITVSACADAAGGSPEAVPFRYRVSTDGGETFGPLESAQDTGVTPAAGAGRVVAVEVRARSLPATKPFVRISLEEIVDGAVVGAVFAVLSEPRYSQADMPSAG